MSYNSNTTKPQTYNLRVIDKQRVDSLADEKGRSKSTILRDSIQLYALTDQELKAGSKLAYIRPDGTVTPIEVLWNQDIPMTPTREQLTEAVVTALHALVPEEHVKKYLAFCLPFDLVKYGINLIEAGYTRNTNI